MRRLTILLATVGALLLVPAAQAFGYGSVTVHIQGAASGEVSSVETAIEGAEPIECTYAPPGPEEGFCEGEQGLNEEESVEGIGLQARFPTENFIVKWTTNGAEAADFRIGHCTADFEEEFHPVFLSESEEYYYSPCTLMNFSIGKEASFNVTATICNKGESEEECLAEEVEGPPLTLNIESGEGTVVSNPAGLECTGSAPESCSTEAIEEGSVKLTASPAPGYVFKSWKKCDSGGVNGRICTINLNEAKTVGANFIPVWALTISKAEGSGTGSAKSKPGGIVCGYNCTTSTAVFKEGKPVEIITKPYKHFHLVEFKNGTGQTAACNGNTSCSYEPGGEDSSTEVLFAEDTKYALSLSKTGGGQAFIKTKPTGIICGFTCGEAEAEYYEGEVLEVSVKLNKGTTSLEWTSGAGTCTGTIVTTEATCSVTMAAAHELVADLQ